MHEANRWRWPLYAAAGSLALLGLVPMANLVTTGRGLPWWNEALREWVVWNAGIVVLALALGFAFTHGIERARARATNALLAPSPRVFAALAGAATFLLAAYFGWSLFRWQPVVGDEFSQRFQAHLLSNGRLFARVQEPAEFFSSVEALGVNGRWFSQFPIGGPALLALGVLAGVPWLVNPLLIAIAVIALYRFAVAASDELTARGAAVLFALSPFVLFMAGSEMNHVGTLAFVLLALAALPAWVAAQTATELRWPAALVGAGMGVAATIRPFDAALAGLAIGIFQVRIAARSPLHRRALLVQMLAGAVPVLLLLGGNWATVGHPLSFAYDVLNGPAHRPGFHVTPLGFEHTPRRGLYMISAYLMKLDVGLFAWPVPSVLLVVVALVLHTRATAWDALVVGILALLMAGYFFYWSESYFVGPRFLFTAVPTFVIFTARFSALVRDRVRTPGLRAAVALLVPIWVLVAWAAPARGNQLYGVRQLAQVSRAQSTASAIVRAVSTAHLTNVVVFIPESWHGELTARLRALGMRPLLAEQTVAHADACTLQQALDGAAGQASASIPQRAETVQLAIERDSGAVPLSGLSPSDQLALVPGRAPTATCREKFDRAASPGGSLAELLPYEGFDAKGDLSGPVVYARDFGRGNEQLRRRFGDRAWYVARVTRAGDDVRVTLEPYPRF